MGATGRVASTMEEGAAGHEQQKKGGVERRSIASNGEARRGAHGRSGLGIIATADEEGPHRSSGLVASTVGVEVALITQSPECKAGNVGDPQGGDDTSALDKRLPMGGNDPSQLRLRSSNPPATSSVRY